MATLSPTGGAGVAGEPLMGGLTFLQVRPLGRSVTARSSVGAQRALCS